MATTSPTARDTGSRGSIHFSPTRVPFELPRSTTCTAKAPPSRFATRRTACWRDTLASSMQIPHCSPRPIAISPSSGRREVNAPCSPITRRESFCESSSFVNTEIRLSVSRSLRRTSSLVQVVKAFTPPFHNAFTVPSNSHCVCRRGGRRVISSACLARRPAAGSGARVAKGRAPPKGVPINMRKTHLLATVTLAATLGAACSSAQGENVGASEEQAASTSATPVWSTVQANRQAAFQQYLTNNHDAFESFKNASLGTSGVPMIMLKSFPVIFPTSGVRRRPTSRRSVSRRTRTSRIARFRWASATRRPAPP